MATVIVTSRDPGLFAELSPVSGEVLVEIKRRCGYRGPLDQGLSKTLSSVLIDAPFHLVADRVGDILSDLSRGEK